jgi:hypothetical protein
MLWKNSKEVLFEAKTDGRGGRSDEMVVEFDDGNPFGRNAALL